MTSTETDSSDDGASHFNRKRIWDVDNWDKTNLTAMIVRV